MTAQLSAEHYVYLCGVLAIVVSMLLRTNVVVPALVATFAVAATHSASLAGAVTSVFNASLVAAKELFSIFLVIALMTALLGALRALGADERMVRPFQRVMVNGHVAFAILAAATYAISLFFWPTPAVPLVAATLLPAAIAAGLPAMGAAAAIAIAGQGMALSSDYVIRVAPSISARAAGIPGEVASVADKALVLSLIVGGTALVLCYLGLRKAVRRASPSHLAEWQAGRTLGQSLAQQHDAVAPKIGSFDKSVIAMHAAEEQDAGRAAPRGAALAGPAGILAAQAPTPWPAILAVLTPVVFGAVVLTMLLPKVVDGLPELRGGDAAALVGGTAALLMLVAAFAKEGPRAMHVAADHIVDGLVFSFRAMGTVLPIAGFFFLGSQEMAGPILGVASGAAAPNLLFDSIQAMERFIPDSQLAVAFGVLVVGMITGIDGSGFSGLPLTGALAGGLGPAAGADPAMLAAVGQMGAVWTGGGTLVAWSSLIAVAGFARVPVLDLVRCLFLPVIAGLVLATVAAVLLW